MKKFLSKCFLLLLIIFIQLLVLNFLYINTDSWKYQNDIDKFSYVPQNIQIANFGSSHGQYGFDWTNSSYTSFNFALSSQSYLFDYALLRQYIKNFEKNAVIIILVEYFQIKNRRAELCGMSNP